MNVLVKIILSVPSLLGLFYLVAIMFPIEFNWVFHTMELYYIQLVTSQLITGIQLIFLIRYIWLKSKLINGEKSMWTWLLVFLSPFTGLVFIWKRIK
jgi:hypothetical protein